MKRVVLYGKSLLMSTVAASLQGSPDIQVFPVDPTMPGVEDHLGAIRPDVVILDLTTIQPDFALGLWRAQPDLLLIGMDLMSGNAMVLSSQPASIMTTEDLLQLLQHIDPDLETHPKTGLSGEAYAD